MTAPEKLLRAATLAGAALAVFVQLALLAPRALWWQDPLLVGLGLAFSALFGLRGELSPELLDSEGALRAYRLAPLVPVALLLVVSTFPTWGSWGPLWVLFGLTLLQLGFGFVPRVRVMSLLTVSVAALGLVVLDDVAVWCLAPVGLAWLLLPSLDRLAVVRLQLGAEVRPALLPALVASLALLGVGAGVFLLASAALPPSTRDFVTVDPLRPLDPSARPGGRLELPLTEIMVLAVLVLLAAWFITRYAIGGRGEATPLEEALPMQVGEGRLLDPEAIEAAVARWPAGPRRDLVRSYLDHLRRLDQLGYRRGAGETPTRLGVRVAAGLAPGAAELPARLAEQFGRARWSQAEVEAVDLEQAEAARQAIEEALLARPGTDRESPLASEA